MGVNSRLGAYSNKYGNLFSFHALLACLTTENRENFLGKFVGAVRRFGSTDETTSSLFQKEPIT